MADERLSVSAEAMALAMRAEDAAAKIRRKVRGTMQLSRAYRRLFFEPDGSLKAEARIVLQDLVETSGIGMAVRDPEQLQLFEGMRRIVLHMFGRFKLPERRLDQLEEDLKLATKDDEE